MELTAAQLKVAEVKLKTYLPRSQTVYGYLLLRNRVHSDPMKFFVDKWPDFNVVVCKPEREQIHDSFKDVHIFANNQQVLAEIIRNPTVFDWTTYFCIGTNLDNMDIFKVMATEKNISSQNLAVCHMMILKDASQLPDVKSFNVLLDSMNESHTELINQTWKFGQREESVRMIQNMLKNFPSCCLLDAEGRPVSWILTYASCAIGMLYTLPEHRGNGYAKVVVSAMANRLRAQGFPVYCFIEEKNTVSYQLFRRLGFTEEPSFKAAWFEFTPNSTQ